MDPWCPRLLLASLLWWGSAFTYAAMAAERRSEAEELFELSLEELMTIEVNVASRVTRGGDVSPVSVTVITREEIRLSGARTLNELLMLRVPGFFLVEDQDDTIAAVRGLAPDNNSKVMLLLDGRNLNADWFWGPPDAVLNGLDLEFIERVEVVRGPGSVTQGQGALLGVIHLITRRDQRTGGLALHFGEAERRGVSYDGRFLGETLNARLYLGLGGFEGRPYRNEGLGRQFEQGMTVYERNHRLKRGEYRNLLLQLDRSGWHLSGFRFDGTRDLYNWRRDRDQVRQVLTGIDLGHARSISGGTLNGSFGVMVDDYALATAAAPRPTAGRRLVPGLVLGGHREVRYGTRWIWSSAELFDGHHLAIGAEYNRYLYGRRNAWGNNFIVNRQEEVLERGRAAVNASNRWVLPGSVGVRSVFFEDRITWSPSWSTVIGARHDAHPDWGTRWSPRLALIWQRSSTSDLRLSWQRGFRGAVGVHYGGGFEGDGLLREAGFGAVEANPYFRANGNRNLARVEPETMDSVELAFRHRFGTQLGIDVVLFANRVQNVIGVGAYFLADDAARARAVAEATRIGPDRIGDWGGVFFFQNNKGDLNHRGAELGLEWDLPNYALNLRFNHSWIRVVSADPGQFGPGNIYVTGSISAPSARSFPENVSRMIASWRPENSWGRWQVDLVQLYYPSWQPPIQIAPDGRSFNPTLDGNHLVKLALAFRPMARMEWEFQLQLNNLLGTDRLYPATSVAGEGEGNLGVPGVEERSVGLVIRRRW